MVRIYVGPKRALWVLPEEALCDRVQFFKSAFQSGFRESSEKVLELPEDDPIAFEFVLDYILQDWPDTEFISTLESPEAIQMAWCQVWVLTDKLGLPDFSEEAIGYYVEYFSGLALSERVVPPAAAKFLYENTSDLCEMRETLTKSAVEVYEGLECSCEEVMEQRSASAASHPKFHADIMVLLKKTQLQKAWKDIASNLTSCKSCNPISTNGTS